MDATVPVDAGGGRGPGAGVAMNPAGGVGATARPRSGGGTSCVLLAEAGPAAVHRAVWRFLCQAGPDDELLIVGDDGIDLGGLVGDPRVRSLVVPRTWSRGARRNHGCDAAAGDVVALWEPHAWYQADRLRLQRSRMEERGADVDLLGGLVHHHLPSGRAWRWAGPPDDEPASAAGLLVRRDAWARAPFPHDGGDDLAAFLDTLGGGPAVRQPGSDLAVVVLPGRSTRPVNPADPHWRPHPPSTALLTAEPDLASSLCSDRTHGLGLRSGIRIHRRQTVAPLTIAAPFVVYDGYGSMAEYLALGCARAGAHVQVAPLRIDPAGLSDELLALWRSSRPDERGVVLCHAWWGEDLSRFDQATDRFVKTTWESSRLPADWPARLNRMTAVIVPSRYVARVLRDSGVTVPVEVVPEGVDPAVYPYLERPRRPGKGVTTLVVGVLAPRKNWRLAVEAWQRAFADDPDARLILKARFRLERYQPDDPRITVVDREEPTRGILHWYHRADVLLALGNEGFGLPLVEGMATGLPVVALDAEAQADVCQEAPGCVLPVRAAGSTPVDEPPFGPAGVRAVPDVDDAARQLRWVAEHPDEARALGRRASAWAHTARDVWAMGPATLEVIERHARTVRPLRRSNALWVADQPAADQPAVTAYDWYCRDLHACLPGVRRHPVPPARWRAMSVHVQHLRGRFDDEDLTDRLLAARDEGAAVVITEHDVGDLAAPWEQAADVLVALDEGDAARLRARWPGHRVEVIPPGCPPWEPAARRATGTGPTLAVLGDLGPLAAPVATALAGIPGASLLHLAPGSDPAGGASTASPGGDPVDLVDLDGPLPRRVVPVPATGAGLVHLLRSQADAVLVGAGGIGRSRGAIRCALAAGSPVALAPGTGHDDLADAVHPLPDPADDIERLLTDQALRRELIAAGRARCGRDSWTRIAARHQALWHTVT